MKDRVRRRGAVLLIAALLFVGGVQPGEAQGPERSPGPRVYLDGDGTVLTEEALITLFAEHRLWFATKGQKGTRGSCIECDLTGVPLANLVEEAAKRNGQDGLDRRALPQFRFTRAVLKNAYLLGMDLHDSLFDYADLAGANLQGSNLNGASFSGANLTHATLANAILTNARLRDVAITDAELDYADLTGAVYEARQKTVPLLYSLTQTKGLDQLRFKKSEAGLIQLRSALKEAGMARPEREVNCSIQRGRTRQLLKSGNAVEAWFRFILFDLTCQYGMEPGLPLRVLGLTVFVFTVPYFGAILFRNRFKRSGIWVIRDSDAVIKAARRSQPVAVGWEPWPGSRRRGKIGRMFRAVRVAFFFSLLSAFTLGFREFNVRSWITRLQSREYSLRGTGWVRALAGFQSLLSVYLLALWVLTYFGRPFE